ncbi:hypothetical protein DW829_13700 [Phocaeicola vulgatus]|nr:hypothetical protein DW837_09405 [Phocaeicola vulgatus]RHC77776.1 hypothetical protein DW829_13700 [Phocaeicola vulgatus]
MTSTVFSAQFENLGELVKSLIFPVGVDTFPTELSGRLRHVLSPAEAVPETLAGYLCLGIGTGNRTGRSEDLPDREPGDDNRAFMQAA